MKQQLIDKYEVYIESMKSFHADNDYELAIVLAKIDAYREILTDLKMLPDTI